MNKGRKSSMLENPKQTPKVIGKSATKRQKQNIYCTNTNIKLSYLLTLYLYI